MTTTEDIKNYYNSLSETIFKSSKNIRLELNKAQYIYHIYLFLEDVEAQEITMFSFSTQFSVRINDAMDSLFYKAINDKSFSSMKYDKLIEDIFKKILG